MPMGIVMFDVLDQGKKPARNIRKNSQDSAPDIAFVLAFLSEIQTPLGSEFEAVWDANSGELYES